MTSSPNLTPIKEVDRPDHTTVPVNLYPQPILFVSPLAAEQSSDATIAKLPLNALDRAYFAGRDFTNEGIMKAYSLTPKAFQNLRRTLLRMKLRDILFHHVHGPYYDTFINMSITGV